MKTRQLFIAILLSHFATAQVWACDGSFQFQDSLTSLQKTGLKLATKDQSWQMTTPDGKTSLYFRPTGGQADSSGKVPSEACLDRKDDSGKEYDGYPKCGKDLKALANPGQNDNRDSIKAEICNQKPDNASGSDPNDHRSSCGAIQIANDGSILIYPEKDGKTDRDNYVRILDMTTAQDKAKFPQWDIQGYTMGATDPSAKLIANRDLDSSGGGSSECKPLAFKGNVAVGAGSTDGINYVDASTSDSVKKEAGDFGNGGDNRQAATSVAQ